MSRVFISSASQKLAIAATPITANPFSIAAWVLVASVPSGTQAIASFGAANAAYGNYLSISNTGTISASSLGNSGIKAATATLAVRPNVWTHVCATFTSTSARAAYVNGANKVASSLATTAGAPTKIGVGYLNTGATKYLDGIVAHVGFWSATLTDSEVKLLAQGHYPYQVNPQNLQAYYPLNSPAALVERDRSLFNRRTYDLTVTGTTPSSCEPPMRKYPNLLQEAERVWAPPGTAPPATFAFRKTFGPLGTRSGTRQCTAT